MKKNKRIFEEEISIKEYENKPLTQFQDEFNKQLNELSISPQKTDDVKEEKDLLKLHKKCSAPLDRDQD